jgi:hypothetical protein
MATTKAQSTHKDFYILGPTVKRDNGVLEAIYSLQYLPQNYRLLLPAAAHTDEMFQIEIASHIKKNALGSRVHFVSTDDGIAPEAYASALLKMARTSA